MRRRALQRILPGQAGHQSFFTRAGRPFCLYVVVGSFGLCHTLVGEANRLLAGLRIVPASLLRGGVVGGAVGGAVGGVVGGAAGR